MKSARTILIALIAFALAACGGGDEATDVASIEDTADAMATDTTQALSDEEALIEFAACMRDQGMDFPDPSVDANGLPSFEFDDPESIDQDAMFEAGEACRDLIEGVVLGLVDFDSSEFDDTFLEYATCMREQGVESIPDSIDIESIVRDGSLPFDPEDPDFLAADERDALRIGRQIVAHLGRPAHSPLRFDPAPPRVDPDELLGIVPADLEVVVAGVRCFCPASQISLRYVEDLAEFEGRLRLNGASPTVLQVTQAGKIVIFRMSINLQRFFALTQIHQYPGGVLQAADIGHMIPVIMG